MIKLNTKCDCTFPWQREIVSAGSNGLIDFMDEILPELKNDGIIDDFIVITQPILTDNPEENQRNMRKYYRDKEFRKIKFKGLEVSIFTAFTSFEFKSCVTCGKCIFSRDHAKKHVIKMIEEEYKKQEKKELAKKICGIGG